MLSPYSLSRHVNYEGLQVRFVDFLQFNWSTYDLVQFCFRSDPCPNRLRFDLLPVQGFINFFSCPNVPLLTYDILFKDIIIKSDLDDLYSFICIFN